MKYIINAKTYGFGTHSRKKNNLKNASKIPGRIINSLTRTRLVGDNNLKNHILDIQTDNMKVMNEWKCWRNNFLINKNCFPGELLYCDNIVSSHNLF